jgi:hypothetical protein
MLHDAISAAVAQGHNAQDGAEAQAGLKQMFLQAQIYPEYRADMEAWTSGNTSTIALRDLYERVFDAPYMASRETRNVVNMIDTAWLHVKLAKVFLEKTGPVSHLAVALGANLFDVVAETDERFATGFCAGSTHMMRAAELAQFQEILAEQQAARAAAPDPGEDDMRP